MPPLVCHNCGATQYVNEYDGKPVCEKCAIWFDYDEEFENSEEEAVLPEQPFKKPRKEKRMGHRKVRPSKH